MTEEYYGRYVAAFNERRYDDLCTFFAPDVVLETVGREIVGHQGIKDFYGFFHDHVKETVTLKDFLGSDRLTFVDAVIRFEGIKGISQQMLDDRGFGGMTPIPQGVAVDVNFLIRYRQRPDGLIDHIRCGVYPDVTPN